MKIMYSYLRLKLNSFKLVAEKQIEYLSKLGVDVESLDENMFVNSDLNGDHLVITHPHSALTLVKLVKRMLIDSTRDVDSVKGNTKILGFDTCESDELSDLAVKFLNTADILAVPSKFCLEVYGRSGVKPRVEVVPHGVDPWWYELPKQAPSDPSVKLIEKLKADRGHRILLFFYWNDIPQRVLRKGWSEVKEFYSKLLSERKDTLLVVKSSLPVNDLPSGNVINIVKWLSLSDLIALYDLSDIVLLFSRAGGFELNALEALGRGIPVIAHNYGSWVDYTPSYLLVPWKTRIPTSNREIIYAGYRYIIDVDKAVDKAHNILENYDEYKARVLEWRDKVLRETYVWDKIAVKIKRLIEELT